MCIIITQGITLITSPGAQNITHSALKFSGYVSNIDEILAMAESKNTAKYSFALNISVGIIITHAMHYSLFLELKTIAHSTLEFKGYFSNIDKILFCTKY